jgi:hypothetical protein
MARVRRESFDDAIAAGDPAAAALCWKESAMKQREAQVHATRPRDPVARPPPGSRSLSSPGPARMAQRDAYLAALHRASRHDPAVQREPERSASALRPGAPRNETGLPDRLKAGIEALSGLNMDDVRVHYGSEKPAQLRSLAYTQGTDIHVAPGEERHLAHEAWHVVQQKQGRVKATRQLKNVDLSDSASLEAEADAMGARSLAWTGGTASPAAEARSVPVVQRKRAPNPYSDATAISGANTAHHIVPDTLLDASMARVAANDRKALQANFLPAFGNLTLKQLFETAALGVKVNNSKVDRPYADANAIATTKFGDLANDQKLTITINAQSFATFKTDYDAMKGGAVTGNATSLDEETKAALLKTFFEWQAGNIFVGASSENRLEPAAKDDFDSDASFFFAQNHVDALKGIFDGLTALKAQANDANNKTATRAKLLEMAAITNAFGAVAAHSNANWVAINPAQTALLAKLEERERPDAPAEGTKQVPKALLVKAATQEAHNDAQGLLAAMNGPNAPPTPVRILAKDVSFTVARPGAVNISLPGFNGVTAVGKAGDNYVMGELVTAARTVLKAALGVA